MDTFGHTSCPPRLVGVHSILPSILLALHIINAPRVSQRNVKIEGLSCFDVKDGDIRTIISVGIIMSWLYLIWNVKITQTFCPCIHLLYNYGTGPDHPTHPTPYLQFNRWYPFLSNSFPQSHSLIKLVNGRAKPNLR